MDDVVIASSHDDAAAVDAIKERHAHLTGALAARTEGLISAAGAGHRIEADAARQALVDWCRHDLAADVTAEERLLYPAARRRPEGRLLVDALLRQHQTVNGLADDVASTTDALRAAAAGRALQALVENRLQVVDELVLPVLGSDPEVSLADLSTEMRVQHVGEELDRSSQSDPHGGSCGCDESENAGFPELDVRAIPHPIRHATVFGALDTLEPGGGLVLVAPHDPLPLLAQIQQRSPHTFAVRYIDRGPETWRLALVRSGPAGRSATPAHASAWG